MSRPRRPLDLTLLLAVAPFFAACSGPEQRHCVGLDGVYIEDAGCDPAASRYVPGSHWVYVPRRYYSGVGSHAGAFRSSTSPGSGHAVVARGGFGHTGAARAGS
jgi:hypothetical protein